MNMGVTELLIILAIIILLFGTKKLKSLGSDLGDTVKGFRQALGGAQTNTEPESNDKPSG
jgi:sec-independent protein translocase protein TatA